MPRTEKNWMYRIFEALRALFVRPRRKQAAALVWRRRTDETIEILTITTRRTKSWSIPKGWPMKGKTLADAAATEAWEEAGVRGTVSDIPLGTYQFAKTRKKAGPPLRLEAEVFALFAENMIDDYPEAGQRERVWRAPEDAERLVRDTGLKAIIRSFSP